MVAAGWVAGSWAGNMLTDEGKMHQVDDIPGGKAISAEMIGDACCYLASEQAAGITGTVLPVDGGFLLTKSAALSPLPNNHK